MTNAHAYIPGLFQDRGISLLDSIGVEGIAFDRETFIELLSNLSEGIAVLGGDVYTRSDGVICSAYASWSCERELSESSFEFVQRSREYARLYVVKYRESCNSDTLYAPVLGEALTAGL